LLAFAGAIVGCIETVTDYRTLPGSAATPSAIQPSPAVTAAPTTAVSATLAGDAEYQASVAKYNAGDYSGAWTQAYVAVQANPKNAAAWQMIGNCQYAKGDKAGALQSFHQSLALNPNNPQLSSFVNQLEGK